MTYFSSAKGKNKTGRLFQHPVARILLAAIVLVLPAIALVDWLSQPRSFAFLLSRKTGQLPEMLMDIPAISDPILVSAEAAQLKSEDVVIGVFVFGKAKAYL